MILPTENVPPVPALSFRDCFGFPLRTPEGRKDIVVGALLLFSLLIGWIFNLGHRLDVVYRIYHREEPYFRGFAPWGKTFVRGLRAFGAIALYLSPAALLGIMAWLTPVGPGQMACVSGAVLCFGLGVYILPGGMTYNAAFRDMSYLYRPDLAFLRAREGGRLYLKAWGIGLSAILLSFLGLLVLGVGFFFTSVWAWQVVGYAFSLALIPNLQEDHAKQL